MYCQIYQYRSIPHHLRRQIRLAHNQSKYTIDTSNFAKHWFHADFNIGNKLDWLRTQVAVYCTYCLTIVLIQHFSCKLSSPWISRIISRFHSKLVELHQSTCDMWALTETHTHGCDMWALAETHTHGFVCSRKAGQVVVFKVLYVFFDSCRVTI